MGEEFLVVEPDAGPHGLADEVHGETGSDALPVVVPLVHSRLRQFAVAVGRDGIVAQGQRDVVEPRLADAEGVAGEPLEGMRGLETLVGIGLVDVLGIKVQTADVVHQSHIEVVHPHRLVLHCRVVEGKLKALEEAERATGHVVQRLLELHLHAEAAAVEHTRLDGEGHGLVPAVLHHAAHIAPRGEPLGKERLVGEIVLPRREQVLVAEGHLVVADEEREPFHGLELGEDGHGRELASIRQIHQRHVGEHGVQRAGNPDAGVAQLEMVGVLLCVVLVAPQHRGGELGHHLLFGELVPPALRSHRVGGHSQRVGHLRGDRNRQQQPAEYQ